jgi:hypothetical protein
LTSPYVARGNRRAGRRTKWDGIRAIKQQTRHRRRRVARDSRKPSPFRLEPSAEGKPPPHQQALPPASLRSTSKPQLHLRPSSTSSSARRASLRPTGKLPPTGKPLPQQQALPASLSSTCAPAAPRAQRGGQASAPPASFRPPASPCPTGKPLPHQQASALPASLSAPPAPRQHRELSEFNLDHRGKQVLSLGSQE